MTNNRKPFEIKEREDRVNHKDERSLLIDIPYQITPHIGSLIKYKKDQGTYAMLCRTVNNLFQPNLNEKRKIFEALAVKALHYAAFGKMEKLDELLEEYPDLIYKRGATLDPCGRIVHGTVYGISLGAKDWNPLPEEPFEEMAEMIERHMKRLPDGEKEIALQKAEQFPEGWEEQEREREKSDFDALKKVWTAIDQSNRNEDCQDAIEDFISYLESQNEVSTGYHYNDKLLSAAQDLYRDNFDEFGGDDSRKNKLMGIKVLGNIQNRMTACLAMAHCDKFMNISERRPLKRWTILHNIQVFHHESFFSPKLGNLYYIYAYNDPNITTNELHHAERPSVCQDFETLIQQKDQVALNGKVPNSNSQCLRNVYR